MAGNNRIRITYDPYRKEIKCEYQREGGNDWEKPSAGGELATLFQQGILKGTLQNHAHNIVRGIANDYCMYGQGVDLLFRGTEEDWEDLKTVVQETSGSTITCKGTAGQLPSAEELLPKIKSIFQKLSEEVDDLTESDVKKPIRQYLETVEPDVVLYVTGTYSAGKSTFINALIGEELLPSAVDPTTAHIFKIVAKDKGDWMDTEVHFKYLGKEVALKFRPDGYVLEDLNQLPDLELKYCLDRELCNAEPGPAYICKALSVLNDFDRLKAPEKENEKQQAEKTNGKTYISPQIELRTPFYHSTFPLDKFHFLIFDTPGTNAENHEDHLVVMKESLKKQTNGLPILLVKPDQMDAKDVGALRRDIHEIGGALDESNILIVVTQADEKSFGILKKQVQGEEKLAARKGAENRICYTSAVMGFYAKKGSYPAMGLQSEDDLEEIRGKFDANSAPYRNGRTRLYQIDSLPPDQQKAIIQAGDQANEADNEQEKLLHNSGLWAVEREIEWFAERFAGYNKCWQAQRYLSDAIEKLKELQDEKRDKQCNLKKESEGKFKDEKKRLSGQIKKASEAWVDKNFSMCINRQTGTAKSTVPDNLLELTEKVAERWKDEKQKHKGNHGKNALDPFREWAKQWVRTRADHGKREIEKFATTFWPQKVRELKDDCVRIVKGSNVLNEEDKEFLEHYILEIRPPELKQIDFSLDHNIAGNKKFLFFSWAKVKPSDCASKMKEAVLSELTIFNDRYFNSLRNDIQNWLKDFQRGLGQQLETLNPVLVELSHEIQAYTEQIEELEQTCKQLEKAQAELSSYFAFKEDGGAK